MSRKITFFAILMMVCPLSLLAQKSDTSWYVKGYNEVIARRYFDRQINLDAVEGIWHSIDGYKYAIERDVQNGRRIGDRYRVIVLESSSDEWNMGDIRGFISQGGYNGIYTMKFYTKGYRTESQSIFLTLESPGVLSYYRVDGGGKRTMLKLYPKVSEGATIGGANVGKKWSGSGFAIGDRYVATNNHVVDSAQTLVCYGVGGDMNKKYSMKVVITDKESDLAIVKVVDEDFPGFNNIPYTINNSVADVGTQVFVLGYPETYYLGSEIKVTSGIINSKTGFQGKLSTYQMDATIQHGSSGGPVFNSYGELVGVSVSGIKSENISNVNYAVKSVNLINLIKSCQEPIKIPTRNMLGALSLQDMIKRITPNVVFIVANEDIGGETGGKISVNNSSGGDIASAEKYYINALEKYNSCDFQGSFDYVKKSINMAETPKAHHLRGVLALYFKDTVMAEQSLNYCINNDYNADLCRVTLAHSIFISQKKYADAIQIANQLLSKNPKNIEAIFIKAMSKAGLGEKNGAIMEYKRAIAIGDPKYNYGAMYNNIAWEYYLAGDYTMANKYIMEALKRDKMQDFIWESDGEIAYQLGDYARCIRSMSNSIAISNDYNSAYFYRGKARLALGDTISAFYDLMSASDMGSPSADSILATLTIPEDLFAIAGNKTYTNPPISRSNKTTNSLRSIEVTSDYLALHIVIPDEAQVDKETYIIDKNQPQDTLYIIKVESWNNGRCSGNIMSNNYPAGYHILYFPAVSENCTEITLKIGDNVELNGIKLQNGFEVKKPEITTHTVPKGEYSINFGDLYFNGQRVRDEEALLGLDLYGELRKSNRYRHASTPLIIVGTISTLVGIIGTSVGEETNKIAWIGISAGGAALLMTGITLLSNGRQIKRNIEDELNNLANNTNISVSPALLLANAGGGTNNNFGFGLSLSIGF